ncbi:MAG: NADH-quinone oxidoreductase subunit NuoK [Thiohalomonadaceae bacterium]
MMATPVVLAFAAALLVIGLAGVLARRNLMFMLISVELLFNAAGLAFIAAGVHWAQPDGQAMYLLILTVSGTEAAVALALMLRIERRFGTLDVDAVSLLRD